MSSRLSLTLSRAWYRQAAWLWLLWPLALLYGGVVRCRRQRFLAGRSHSYRPQVPVVVIGNITAGGTGKTPLTLALARQLQQQGLRVAIVSRGHGGKSPSWPLEVKADTDPALCGDEPLIYARRAGCPVVVDPQRVRAVRHLEARYQPQLILSDDGLQHYALQRDLEIAVIDGERGLGNGALLPQGPLREAASRLLETDLLVSNGPLRRSVPHGDRPLFEMQVQAGRLHNLATGEQLDIEAFRARHPERVHAVAGIGNPERFFSTLTRAGFAIISHVFEDHHHFTAGDLAFDDALPVLMTEKDAVKCAGFASARHWYLSVDAVLPPALLHAIRTQLTACGIHFA